MKVVAQYIGGISFPIVRERRTVLPATEKSRQKTNFSLPIIEHIFMYITRLSCGPMHCGTSLAGTPVLFLFGIVFLLLY